MRDRGGKLNSTDKRRISLILRRNMKTNTNLVMFNFMYSNNLAKKNIIAKTHIDDHGRRT